MSVLPKNTPFTQVPNELIDTHLNKIKNSELKVYMLICRKTLGFQKRKDKISLSQMTKITGLAKSTVIEAIKGLQHYGLIHKYTGQQTHQYGIEIGPLEKPDGSISEPLAVQKSDREVVRESDTQKKASKQKEINTTTDSSSELSEDVFKVITRWNQIFDHKILTIDDAVVPMIQKVVEVFTTEQLFTAMENRSGAPFYENRYALKHNPKSFFGYPQTIKNDLSRAQESLFSYDQKVDRITGGKNKDSDFEIVKNRLDSQGRPLWKLIH